MSNTTTFLLGIIISVILTIISIIVEKKWYLVILFIVLTISFVILFVSSCASDTNDKTTPIPTQDNDINAEISYIIGDSVYYGALYSDDNEYQITMWLEINMNGEISGNYYYNNHKQLIPLIGNAKDNSYLINEYFEGPQTGQFVLELNTDNSLTGRWESVDKKEVYKVRLSPY